VEQFIKVYFRFHVYRFAAAMYLMQSGTEWLTKVASAQSTLLSTPAGFGIAWSVSFCRFRVVVVHRRVLCRFAMFLNTLTRS
jgi:hypothetical protein